MTTKKYRCYLISICVIILMTLSLCACVPKTLAVDYIYVEGVEIVDSYYEPEYLHMVYKFGSMEYPYFIEGSIPEIKTVPAKYEITVMYYGDKYTLPTDKETYENFKERIGESVTGVLETTVIDNGTINQRIVEILDY